MVKKISSLTITDQLSTYKAQCRKPCASEWPDFQNTIFECPYIIHGKADKSQ